MKKLLFVVTILCASAFSQTPVVLMPVPKPQYFDQSGRVLSFGCLFTYNVNTTNPLATYTDQTGTSQNQNPVILSAGGTASIWIQAGVAYTVKVVSAGGTKCATGSTQYTVDGIGGGITNLTTNVTYSTTPIFNIASQNQLFKITLTGDATSQPLTAAGIVPPALVTWEIAQDNVGGHLFTWPANSVGGCTIGSAANQVTLQHFIWDGVNAIATGPCVTGNGPAVSFGVGTATALTSICTNPATAGFIRMCKTDSVFWRNNANGANQGITPDSSDRGVWSFAGGLETSGTVPDIFLGGTTASFPRMKRNATAVNFRLGDDTADAPITASTLGLSGPLTSTSATYVALGPEVSTPSNPSASTQKGYFKAGAGWCALNSSGAEYCTASNSGAGVAVQASSITLLGSPVGITTATTVMTKSVTMPSSGCPCRAFVAYGAFSDFNTSGQLALAVYDGTNTFATAQSNTTGSATEVGTSASSFSTGTYSNGASITFTLQGSANSGGPINVHVNNGPGLGQATWMNVAILTSN